MSIVCVVLLCLSGNVYQDFFEQGNTAYAENRLDDAIQAYERLLSSGVENASVFYNLGSAYFHGGDIGRAVLNYERALVVDPNYAPPLRALELIEASGGRYFDVPIGFRPSKGAFGRWGSRVLVGFMLIFWWLFWGIILWSQWHPLSQERNIALAALLAVLLLGGVVYVRSCVPDPAVVLVADVPIRYGPDAHDGLRRLLDAGERIQVEMIDGAWARVETGAGLRGWVRTEYLGAVSPPFRD